MNVDGHIHQSRRISLKMIRIKFPIFQRKEELVRLFVSLSRLASRVKLKDIIDTSQKDSLKWITLFLLYVPLSTKIIFN